MAESNATQVILTDDGIKIIKAQNTADNAAGGVINLNDPNLMSVIEKQTAVAQYAGLTSQYNVILARAKDANISTTDLTTAYTNLNTLMADILADTAKSSDIDRYTYNSLIYAYNTALSSVQTALKDSFNADIDDMQSSVSVASQAASSAVIVASQAATTGDNANQVASRAIVVANDAQSAGNNATSVANNASQAASSAILAGSTASVNADKAVSVANQAKSAGDNATSVANNATSVANNATSVADDAFSKAQEVGSQASAEISSNSTATAKAQSTADNAFSQATTAIDNGKVTSQAVTDLKDGSKLTIADLENGLATKVANSDYASYKEQTASQIGQMVTNGAFSAYQTQTANLISSKVATKDFSAYQDTTAKAISSKVESSDFNTYKTQTADLINDKVSNSAYASDKTQTASEIADRVSNSAFSTYQTQTDKLIGSKVDNGAFKTYQTQTAELINSKVDNGTYQSDKTQTANQISSKVSSTDFSSYKSQTDKAIESKVSSADFNNLKISNRNLALGTATPIKFVGQNINNQAKIAYGFSKTISQGTVVTATFDVSSTTGVGTFVMQFYGTDVGASWQGIASGDLVNGTKHISVTITTEANQLHIYPRLDFATGDVTFSNFIISESSKEVSWTPAPEDLATQSQITQLSDDINLRVTKDGLVDQINIQAGNTLISSSGQLTLSGKSVLLDSVDPVIMKSANIADLAVGTAQIKDAAVNSAKIARLAVGTAQIGDGAITNAKIGKLAVGTAQIANAAITDAQIGNVSANKLTAGTSDFNTITGKNINASNITTGTLSTDRLNVGKLSALSANLGNVTTGSLKGVDIVANSFSTPNGSFTTDENGSVVASNLTIRGVTNLVYNAALLGGSGSNIPGWTISNNGYYSSYTLHDGVSSIGFNSSTGSGVWTNFAQSKLYPLNGLTGLPYSASVWFIDDGSEAAMKYQFTLAFFDTNGNRINGYVGQTWYGISSAQPWRYITINNAVSPSNAAYVGLQYWAYNGTGHALFSSPMLTQTAQSTGYQPDTGNVVSAGEIDGSVINGSTINGTTFNAGTRLNSYGNTSYPLTINQDGSVTSTSFETIDTEIAALRTVIKDGTVKTNLRGMTPFATGMYSAADVSLGAGQLALLEGYSTSQDPNFNATGLKTTGYAILDASAGLSLHGTTQAINFSGTDQSQTTGITMNSYGNIIGYPNATWWRIVSNSGSNIANFGIDRAGSNVIQFNRELDIGNFHINTGHTFTSWDKGAIHFAKGGGGAANIYAGAVNYTSLVKSSLLSVKKDVQKADTAYWAQLVNSIDLATYQYKTDDNTSHLRLSSIVDDVNVTKQWQLPDVFISRDENGKLNGVDDSVLLNATLATVQEQQKQIDQLNGHLLELEAKLNG